MANKLVRASVLAIGLALGSAAIAASKPDVPSVEDIMSEAHNKKKGVTPKVEAAVKDGKWDDAAKASDRLKVLGEALGKNAPAKGSKESWKKLSDEYKANTAAIDAGVKKKDAKAAQDALAKLAKACEVCHEAHRE